MQNFENYPKLSDHIERMASSGDVGSNTQWNDFIRELNIALPSKKSNKPIQVLEWLDRPFSEIPEQDNPLHDPSKQECIIVCQQEGPRNPEHTLAPWIAIHVKLNEDGEFILPIVGVFSLFEVAVVFANAYAVSLSLKSI